MSVFHEVIKNLFAQSAEQIEKIIIMTSTQSRKDPQVIPINFQI
jgi:hypothetical protein